MPTKFKDTHIGRIPFLEIVLPDFISKIPNSIIHAIEVVWRYRLRGVDMNLLKLKPFNTPGKESLVFDIRIGGSFPNLLIAQTFA
jgi:hypothetical protein